MKNREKKIVFYLCLVTIIILLSNVIIYKKYLIEQWYIYKLESQDIKERSYASNKLNHLTKIFIIISCITVMP